ncbi:hypothetical protein BKA67DRAFT_566715 [Truncatella angustata]|uniref:Acid ceramidase N-terminal domain-containing protein n=1 Tax=Truncatella angustata TaxID=152316 RepID=A0A9P8UHX0_9PEZI|nr:uncharacterized protein BKA67DRAFT_566715 [Truncatella angustata]KAH6652496.1 hypothetical protein BKA67DRAFT_566715 [Truncatella angustata]
MAPTSPIDPSSQRRNNISGPKHIPPYRIDLSKSPDTRYEQIPENFGPRMRSLRGLFDEILSFLPNAILRRIVAIMENCTHFACVMDSQTAQIRWIRRGTVISNSEWL